LDPFIPVLFSPFLELVGHEDEDGVASTNGNNKKIEEEKRKGED